MPVPRRARRLPAVLALLALVLGGLVAVGPASPAAAAGCFNTSCAGKDPNQMGCTGSNVGSTEVWAEDESYSFAMRNSTNCSARWARWVYDSNGCCVATYFSIERQVVTPYGYARAHYYVKSIGGGGVGTYWTKMVPNTLDDRTRVCYDWADSTPDFECSGWVY